MKNTLSALLGPFPQEAPLEPEILEQVDCGSYVREKVSYGVEPNDRAAAYLLIPKDAPECKPAIYCHHQHASNYALGKSEVVGLSGDKNLAYAHELAERGFITFAPDALAFEERNSGDTTWRATYSQLATRLVQGRTLLAKVLHDVSAGLDYLETRTEVASDRIGFIGHSYGGRMALWAPAFDIRIKASVSNCGCSPYREMLSARSGIQMEFCVPGIMEWGDIDLVVRMIAPRALMISATRDDVWSRGAEQLYAAVRDVFEGSKLELALYEGGHQFTPHMRERAYTFLTEHLAS